MSTQTVTIPAGSVGGDVFYTSSLEDISELLANAVAATEGKPLAISSVTLTPADDGGWEVKLHLANRDAMQIGLSVVSREAAA